MTTIVSANALIQCHRCGLQEYGKDLYETENGPACDKCWAPNDNDFPKGLKYDPEYYWKQKWKENPMTQNEVEKAFNEWWKFNYDKCGRYTTEDDAKKTYLAGHAAATAPLMGVIKRLKGEDV